MANRSFKPLGGSLTQGVVCLTGQWTYGENGAITDVNCDGFTVGALSPPFQTITLDDKYTEFVGFHATFAIKGAMDLQNGFSTELPMLAVAYEEDVLSTKTIKMACLKVKDGSPQGVSETLTSDYPRGTKVSVLIWVKNSSV